MSRLFPLREDLIGKRILTVRCATDETNAKCLGAPRRGVIRASTSQNAQDSDIKVLVEFDGDKSWRCRQWVEIYKEFDVVLIEDKLVWTHKHVGSTSKPKPALVYRSLVVNEETTPKNSVYLEVLGDKALQFRSLSSLEPFKVDDLSGLADDDRRMVMLWVDCHLTQLLLLGSPSLAEGLHVLVYNSGDDDSQWHSARVLSADDQTKLITLLDESKSEQRTVNAALIQICGLPMIADSKLWNTALKLAKKRPSEGLNSPIDSKRTRKMGAEDQGTFSGQLEHFSPEKFDASLSTVHCLLESPPNTVQCLANRNTQHVPATPPSASLSQSVVSTVSVNSPPPVYRTIYTQSPVLNHTSASTHPPQCSISSATTATNASSYDDSRKFCSLFRYRPQSPATFQKKSPAGFYHNSSPGARYHSPPVLPLNRTNLAEPLQKTGTGITSDGSCPKMPQNGLCSPIRTQAVTHSAEGSNFEKVPENHETGQDGQLHIPVVIHSERERKRSSPGNRNARHASGGDRQSFLHNTSPVKTQNLIVIDLVDDDDSMQASKTLGSEKTDASNGAMTSQANQSRVSHQLNQAREIHPENLQVNQMRTYFELNQTRTNRESAQTGANLHLNQTRTNRELPRVSQVAPVDQSKFKLNNSSYIQEMYRFIGKVVEESPMGKQLTGSSSHIKTSSEVVAKSGLKKNISQRQSTLTSSTASNQPTEAVKKLKQDASSNQPTEAVKKLIQYTSAQRQLTLPRESPTKKQSSETTARLNSTKGENLPTLKNVKSKTKTLNSVRTVSRKVLSVPRIGASGNSPHKLQQNVVKAYDEETQGLVGVMKLLKILDEELVWADSAEGSWEDVTMATKKRKNLVKNSVNSPQSELVNSWHSEFVSPRSSRKLPSHDCDIKIEQFKKLISDERGYEYESPSCILSKKSLNGPDALLPKNSFVQEDSCLDLASIVTICRECKSGQKSLDKSGHKGLDKNTKILCRFFAFRRLNTTSKGTCKATGFCSPRDADGADVSLWMPHVPITAPHIDIDMAKYIIKNVGNRFCELVEQEKEAMTWSPAYSEIVWKRPVHGVREMCDVCSTTLFNIHWVCGKCGFVVCLDCFRTMTQKCAKCTDEVGCKICDRGHNRWPRCTHSTRPMHVPSQLMLTQIIPSDVLWSVGRMIHDVRKKWKMFTNCPCGEDRQECEAGKELVPADEAKEIVQESCSSTLNEKQMGTAVSSVSPLTDNAATQKSVKTEDHKLLTSSPEKKETNPKVFDVLPKTGDSKPRMSSSGKKEVDKKVCDESPKNGDSKLTSSTGKKEMKKKVFDVLSKNGGSKPLTSSSVKKEMNKKVFPASSKIGDSIPRTSSSDKKEKKKNIFDVLSKNGGNKPRSNSSGKKEVDKKDFAASLKNGDSKPRTSSSDKKEKKKNIFDVLSKNGGSKSLTSSPEKKEVDKKVSSVPQTTVWKSPKSPSERPLMSSSALREMIMNNISLADVKIECKTPNKKMQTLDDIAQRVAGNYSLHRVALAPRLLHLQDPPKQISLMRNAKPITRNSLPTTQLQYPNVAHTWLDDGRLLQLLEPRHHANIHLFQQQWKRGQPVLISKCQQYLNQDLWLPESFAEEFGDEENDLVDCSRKVVLVGHKMRRFWDGFEHVTARLKDKHGQPMILKLKDWPPTEDFSELLPSRFEDLLLSLPMPEYTHRTGVFNLVSRLPEFFVRPDLGPKMYNAYGSALYPQVGSTNLHLDVSDAVNLILYVGIPMDDKEDHEAAAVEAMKEAGCCDLTMGRILNGGEKPGALWHIFDPQDSDKIRDLLHKVASEVGEPIGPHHDPIHDQSWYLDEKLRRRLFAEYAVECYTLVQCVGDAIFIPAGAPHQVRNLHSCIKAAEDFVSPENLSYCFKLTQEFRHLSDKHSNHEDKLQVKNVIYHAVKDAIAVLVHNDP